MKRSFALSASASVAASMVLLLAACGGGGDSTSPTAPPVATAQEACAAFKSLSIEAAAIGKPTSGALVQTATLVAANASGNSAGEYCAVTGIVIPATAGAPTMEFQVNLPTNWNHKALQFGGGGYDGTLVTGLGPYVSQPNGTPTPLAQGYVTLGGDGGHKGVVFDGTFALNDEALMNYGQLSIKKVHDVAMALMTKRYGEKPKRFYFIGGSQGGHEALDAAARYGADYDGVVSNYPAYNLSLLQQASWYVGKALYENNGAGWLNDNKRKLVVNATYAACDSLDGLVDGIIGNVSACNAAFNVATLKSKLRCAGGADTGDNCLSDAQITAVQKISSDFDLGFPIAGQQVFSRWPLLEGGGLHLLRSSLRLRVRSAAQPGCDAARRCLALHHWRGARALLRDQGPSVRRAEVRPRQFQDPIAAVRRDHRGHSGKPGGVPRQRGQAHPHARHHRWPDQPAQQRGLLQAPSTAVRPRCGRQLHPLLHDPRL